MAAFHVLIHSCVPPSPPAGEFGNFTNTFSKITSRLAKEDAENLPIPHICLFSPKDGDPDLMREYAQLLKAKDKSNHVETFTSMFHGWMGARANLENEDNAREFERG